MQFSLSRGLGLLALSGAIAACSDLPNSPVSASSAPSLESAAPLGWTLDDEFERIAREEVSGYAGDFLLADGTPVVLLVDPGQRAAAARSISARRERAGMPHRDPEVRTAQFDFPTLRQWRDRLIPLMEADLAFALDIDEAQNRVWVAVENHRDGADVRAAAVRLGIPASAVAVEVQQRPQPRATVGDYHRPALGGVQIVSSTGNICTLGFSAIMDGTPVFVTNSHCSGTRNQLDSSPQRQPTNSAGNEIGYELRDKGAGYCPALAPVNCRKSDSSIYGYSAGVPYSLGQIARTLSYGANQRGSLEINPLNPYFQITSKNTSGIPVGTWVDKVGRTSGWTRGQVQKSCVFLKDGIYFECQYVTSTWSEGGDSGSPMFVVGSTGVALHGLLWGGPAGDWTTTWYSPVGGVEKDFGVTLQVF